MKTKKYFFPKEKGNEKGGKKKFIEAFTVLNTIWQPKKKQEEEEESISSEFQEQKGCRIRERKYHSR